jgi:hypothetical protein
VVLAPGGGIGQRALFKPLCRPARTESFSQQKLAGKIRLISFRQRMITRRLNVAEKPLQTKLAVKALPAGDFHRLGNNCYSGVGYVGFSRENIMAIPIDRFEIVIISDSQHIVPLNFSGREVVVHFPDQRRRMRFGVFSPPYLID